MYVAYIAGAPHVDIGLDFRYLPKHTLIGLNEGTMFLGLCYMLLPIKSARKLHM